MARPAPMIVMPSNNSGAEARALAAAYPGRLGHLYGPGGWRGPFPEFPHALDNGAFGAFLKRGPFNAPAFRKLVASAAAAQVPPRWAAVPDVVADRDATLAMWAAWAPELRVHGWPLAFVVQDGMTPADVPADAAVVFVGGSREWKRATTPMWCREFPRVHVGRVNTERWCWYYDECGAESVDGTGWFRGRRRQIDGLWHYLADSSGHGIDAPTCPTPRLFVGRCSTPKLRALA